MNYEQLELFVLERPHFDVAEAERFLKLRGLEWRRVDATDAELLIEFAGRVCYLSFGDGRQSPRDTRGYIRNLIEQGHESVLEHASWSILLDRVSRSFANQLVRHRAGFSYSQLSQQYNVTDQCDAVIPHAIRGDDEALAIWSTAIGRAQTAYRDLVEYLRDRNDSHGLSRREALRLANTTARAVLPGGTSTAIVVTANARAFRHFLTMRGSILGDPEMREVSVKMLKVLQAEAPAVFEDFSIVPLSSEANGEQVVRGDLAVSSEHQF